MKKTLNKTELKGMMAEVCNQLTEACGLTAPYKVAALVEDDGSLVGWRPVIVQEDGQMTPQGKNYASIKEIIEALAKEDKQ